MEQMNGEIQALTEDNIKINHKKIGCAAVNWIHLAQDRDKGRSLVNTVMKPRVP
jgi:hypothetical protein